MKGIIIEGTASDVGKSLVVTAMGRAVYIKDYKDLRFSELVLNMKEPLNWNLLNHIIKQWRASA